MSGKRQSKRRRYDAEFKANALKLLEDGRSVSSVASSLGINENMLYNWRNKSFGHLKFVLLVDAPRLNCFHHKNISNSTMNYTLLSSY